MQNNNLFINQDQINLMNINKKSFCQKIHPSLKICILFFILFVIFRLPVQIDFNKDNHILFFIYSILFFVLFFISMFYNFFLKHLYAQIKKMRFLLLLSLFLQFQESNNFENNQLLSIPIYYWSNYNFLIFIIFLFLYNFTKNKIRFKMLYFIFLFFCFFVFPCLLCDQKYLGNYFNISFFQSSHIQQYFLKKESLLKNLLILVRLLCIIMIIFNFNNITNFNEINDGLNIILKPLKKIKIPVEIFIFMLSLIFISIPFLFQEMNKILKAQMSRGLDLENKKILKKINNLLSLLVPIFILIFKRSLVLANAMEIRGYVLGAPRTKLISYKVRVIDLFITMIFLFFVIVVYCLY